MIVIAGLILGALIGAGVAHRRKGTIADILQYAAGYGIAFGLLALFLTIYLARVTAG